MIRHHHRSVVGTSLSMLLALGLACTRKEASDSDSAGASGPKTDEAGAPNAPEPKGAGGEPRPDGGSALPEGAALLDRAVEALGGQAKLEAIHSFTSTGKVSVAGQNITGQTRTVWKDGDFYSETDVVGVGRVKVGKHGNDLWSEDPIMGLRRLAGKEAEQAGWQSTVALPASWKTFFDRAETTGAYEEGGKKRYDVKLKAASGDAVTMTLDAESGLPVAQSFQQVSPTGVVPVTLRFEDYRTVDGIQISHRQVANMSLVELTTEITSFVVNAEVDPSQFAMPTGGTKTVEPQRPATRMPFGPDGKPGLPAPSQQGREPGAANPAPGN